MSEISAVMSLSFITRKLIKDKGNTNVNFVWNLCLSSDQISQETHIGCDTITLWKINICLLFDHLNLHGEKIFAVKLEEL